VQKRLEEEEIRIALTEAATEFLVKHGTDEHFGARPLKRAIQRLVQNPLALELLEGKFHDGDHIRATVQGDALSFERIA
jgi:ATP-dependent Clp protease ATP-binding subunit ClpA